MDIVGDKIRQIGGLSTGKGGGKSEYLGSTAVGVPTQVRGEELERDFAIEFGVLRQIDLPHPAGADLLDYTVVGDHCAADQRHVGSGLVVVRLTHASKCSHSYFTRSMSSLNCSS